MDPAVWALAGVLLGLLVGGGVVYALVLARASAEICEEYASEAEETAQTVSHLQVTLSALERRMHAAEINVKRAAQAGRFERYVLPSDRNAPLPAGET